MATLPVHTAQQCRGLLVERVHRVVLRVQTHRWVIGVVSDGRRTRVSPTAATTRRGTIKRLSTPIVTRSGVVEVLFVGGQWVLDERVLRLVVVVAAVVVVVVVVAVGWCLTAHVLAVERQGGWDQRGGLIALVQRGRMRLWQVCAGGPSNLPHSGATAAGG